MAERLFVVVPGLTPLFTWRKQLRKWNPLVQKLKDDEALTEKNWLVLDFHLHVLSRGTFDERVIDLIAEIDQKIVKDGPFGEITLIGHSCGALIARKAYLVARGIAKYGASDLRDMKRDWSQQVKRLVLLAGVNAGVKPRSIPLRIAAFFAPVLGWFGITMAAEALAGSPFITDLRICWIRDLLNDPSPVEVVQVLGTDDSLVRREDSVDVEQFRNAWHISLPRCTHANVYQVDDAAIACGKYKMLQNAIIGPKQDTTPPDEIDEYSKIFFVMHGIYANRDLWVEEVAKQLEQKDTKIKAIRGEYGIFTALHFVFPSIRQAKVRWFQRAYSDTLAKNPRAEYYFVGHSYGTYLLGHGLKAIPGMRFKRAYIAGSVLRPDFDWDLIFNRNQLDELRVDRAYDDFPVGVLCTALQFMRADVGPGGVRGFRALDRIREIWYFKGGHSAAIRKQNQPNIVEYVFNGTMEQTPLVVTDSVPLKWRLLIGASGFLALLLLGADGWWIYSAMQHPELISKLTPIGVNALLVLVALAIG